MPDSAKLLSTMDWWSLSDAALESQCDRDHYRASGPGGQHRNKTDSAVRLRHCLTGVTVTATERRSQAENRAVAIKRMREALAFQLRSPVEGRPLPDGMSGACQTGRLTIGVKNPRFLPVAAYVLDLLNDRKGQLSTVAETLGVSTASTAKFLESHPDMWQAAQQIRKANDLSPLRQ